MGSQQMTVRKRVPRSYKGLKRSLQLFPAECSTGEEDKHRDKEKKVVTGKKVRILGPQQSDQ